MEFQMKDTVQVQIQSVINFMGALGYVPDPRVKNLSFTNLTDQKSAAVRVSFRTATKLHNSTLDDWKVIEDRQIAFNSKVNLNVAWPCVSVLLADASKLVVKSKVAIDRKGLVIINSENAKLIRTENTKIAKLITE
ncbi:hypothetical protein Amme3_00155 [Pseudomonas phage vB_PpuM-Amme-3]|uniref:DUF7390 domain-containing protein n=2 Tax=Tartuvirus TaxID=3424912 RepID=A0AAX4MXW7_9CAUD